MAKFSAVSLGGLNATASVPTDLQRVYTGQGSSGATVGFDIAGTYVGTLSFEFTIDDVNWFPVVAHLTGPSGFPGPTVLTTTTTGRYAVSAHGYSQVRVRMSAYTSGSAMVATAITASQETLLILRELMIQNELLVQGLNLNVDLATEYRNDPTYGM
jgi:hypothetical protein